MATTRYIIDGKEVAAFVPIDWNSEGLKTLKSKFDGNYIFHDEDMGDHSEYYIIEFNEDKTEKARWNVRDISWFEWK